MTTNMLERMTREANVMLAALTPGSVEQVGSAKMMGLILWFFDAMCVWSRGKNDIPDVLARSWTAIVAFLPEYTRAGTPKEQNDVLQRMSRVVADRK